MTVNDSDRESDIATAMARVHEHWQHAIAEAARRRPWVPPRFEVSGGPVPWEEVASLAVECIWADVEEIIRPVVSMLEARPATARSTVPGESTITDAASSSSSSPSTSPSSSSSSSSTSSTPPGPSPWMTADETARVLDTTAHTLRRLAREDRSPVVARRIGGRWRFARRDVERYVSGEPPDAERQH